MILYHHHRDRRFRLNRRAEYKLSAGPDEPDFELKPRGLWLSVPEGPRDGWWNWCEREAFHKGRRWRTPVEVDVGRLLVVRHPREVEPWTRNWKIREESPGLDWVDWRAMGEAHAGLLVEDYVSWPEDDFAQGVISPTWWYAWDCSSACVWDLSAARVAGRPERVEFHSESWEVEYA